MNIIKKMAEKTIEFYTWKTPNGRKIAIALEEMGLPHKTIPIDINAGDQKKPEFLQVNPNGKIPALIDRRGDQPVTIFESGAILLYLAEKEGKFLPKETQAKYSTISWLMWQMAGVGPMFGQYGFFARHPEKIPVAIDRYKGEANRLMKVLDDQLAQTSSYMAGPEYTVADMATYPWIAGMLSAAEPPVKIEEYPHVQKWKELVGSRPAVQKGMKVLEI